MCAAHRATADAVITQTVSVVVRRSEFRADSITLLQQFWKVTVSTAKTSCAY